MVKRAVLSILLGIAIGEAVPSASAQVIGCPFPDPQNPACWYCNWQPDSFVQCKFDQPGIGCVGWGGCVGDACKICSTVPQG